MVTGPNAGAGETAAAATVGVEERLLTLRTTPYGVRLLLLCILIAMTEGYDVQAMAFAAPQLRTAWALGSEQVGMLLAGSVLGQVTSSFLLTPLADYVGRKPAIIAGLAVAAVATGAGALAPDVPWLLFTRVIAGLGLGVALPVTVAFSMELAPPRLRTLVVVLVMSGYPLGAALGGWAVGEMIETRGYGLIFILGGVAAGVSALICLLALPESPYFLARRERHWPRLERLLRRLEIQLPAGALAFSPPAAPRAKSSVAALFTSDRRFTTLTLWLIAFCNLASVYFFTSWLPSLFHQRGLESDLAVKAAAVFSAGGVVGGLVLAGFTSRLGPATALSWAYVVAVLNVVTLAFLTAVGPAFLVCIFLSGAAIVGSQFCLTAAINQFYPSAIRATGVGWATGAGRVGAVCAPLVGGLVVGRLHSAQHVFLVTAAPILAAFLAMLVLRQRRSLGSEG